VTDVVTVAVLGRLVVGDAFEVLSDADADFDPVLAATVAVVVSLRLRVGGRGASRRFT
jgi:hypothetical protein